MLPPGARAPALIQTLGWWNRAIPFLERCRARYVGRGNRPVPAAA